jgi:hypothetical protein
LKFSRAGKGKGVAALLAAAGTQDLNLMQKMYYNGHNKAHGAKVQHLLQANRIVYSWTCPLRNHDSLVLCKSVIHLMLSAVFVNNDPRRPVKCVTDEWKDSTFAYYSYRR